MDQESFENNVQDWMNDGFASGWPTASGANGVACDFELQLCMLQLVGKVEASMHKGLDMRIQDSNLHHCGYKKAHKSVQDMEQTNMSQRDRCTDRACVSIVPCLPVLASVAARVITG